ncbi:MAG: glycosyltransferase family 8 protein [Holosporaceae bacterium]|nr:glycosyltransferase family 8 protein [Holosporaceae bacterium]
MKFLFEGGFLRQIAAAVLSLSVGAEAFGGSEVKIVQSVKEAKPAFGGNANIVRSEVKIVRSVEKVKPAFGGNGVSVVFASDDNYAMYLAVALRSLIDNSSRNRSYDVWILDGGISEDKRKVILDLPKGCGNFSIRFFDIKPFAEKHRDILRMQRTDLSVACYYRLFIPQIFAAYRRMLYLDCDLLVLADVAKLFDTDLEGKSIGAIGDGGFPVKHMQLIRGDKWREYFNSGVLLFDVKKAMKEDIGNRCLEYLFSHKNDDGKFFEDQDVLNAVCTDNLKLMDWKWNFQAFFPEENLIPGKDVLIRHYVGPKPWKHNIGFGDLWWKYAEKTPFCKQIISQNRLSIMYYMIFNYVNCAVISICRLLHLECLIPCEKAAIPCMMALLKKGVLQKPTLYRRFWGLGGSPETQDRNAPKAAATAAAERI